jgi:predicted DNA-binding transcriptional regulator AlpA
MSQQSTGLSRNESKPGGRKLLSFAELKSVKGIPYSRQWIAKLIQMGKFPAPVKPGTGAFNAWFDDELDAYLNNLVAERDRDQVA